MAAYYNELDPLKAEVLREAVRAGAIAPGDVDERSIVDVQPSDLVGYTQCHFFGGGGFWSLALRYAGWPDDRPAWTASTPCPSFSAAGKGRGFDDPRHLWPDVARLVRECRPGVLFGEQVAAAIGHGWLDLVFGDLEAEGYAVAAAVLGAHSVGAPHIRQRLFFCADTERGRCEQRDAGQRPVSEFDDDGAVCVGANADGRQSSDGDIQRSREQRLLAPDCGFGECANSKSDGRGIRHSNDEWAPGGEIHSPCDDSEIGRPGGPAGNEVLSSDDTERARLEGHFGDVREWRGPGWLDPHTARSVAAAGATRGFWGDCDWWYGRDEKFRPAGPGVQPLAHGSPARVGRLRLYGDGIVVQAAQAFIESYVEARGGV